MCVAWGSPLPDWRVCLESCGGGAGPVFKLLAGCRGGLRSTAWGTPRCRDRPRRLGENLGELPVVRSLNWCAGLPPLRMYCYLGTNFFFSKSSYLMILAPVISLSTVQLSRKPFFLLKETGAHD